MTLEEAKAELSQFGDKFEIVEIAGISCVRLSNNYFNGKEINNTEAILHYKSEVMKLLKEKTKVHTISMSTYYCFSKLMPVLATEENLNLLLTYKSSELTEEQKVELGFCDKYPPEAVSYYIPDWNLIEDIFKHMPSVSDYVYADEGCQEFQRGKYYGWFKGLFDTLLMMGRISQYVYDKIASSAEG